MKKKGITTSRHHAVKSVITPPPVPACAIYRDFKKPFGSIDLNTFGNKKKILNLLSCFLSSVLNNLQKYVISYWTRRCERFCTWRPSSQDRVVVPCSIIWCSNHRSSEMKEVNQLSAPYPLPMSGLCSDNTIVYREILYSSLNYSSCIKK